MSLIPRNQCVIKRPNYSFFVDVGIVSPYDAFFSPLNFSFKYPVS